MTCNFVHAILGGFGASKRFLWGPARLFTLLLMEKILHQFGCPKTFFGGIKKTCSASELVQEFSINRMYGYSFCTYNN